MPSLDLTVALVEPSYEVNLGHIARVMANFGFRKLLLIDPKVGLNEARMFASHGVYVLERAERCRFEDLTERFDYLIGTTAISSVRSANILRSTVSPRFMAEALRGFSGSVCLIFGRDTTGLTNEELEVCDMVVSIPADSSYPTLNLGHAAAIILYELSRNIFKAARSVASKDRREMIVRYAVELAEASGIQRHKLPLLEKAVRHIIGRGGPTEREATLIIGLLRKAKTAILRARPSSRRRSPSEPSDPSQGRQ